MLKRTESYIHTVKSSDGSKWHSCITIRLNRIETMPHDIKDKVYEYTERMLSHQVDLISSLASMPPGGAAEVRYLFRPSGTPEKRGKIDVIIRLRAEGEGEDAARDNVIGFYNGVWPSLVSVSKAYIWEPVATQAEYMDLAHPFEPEYLAEVMRREAVLSLERLNPVSWPRVGFLAEQHKSARKKRGGSGQSNIYLVFPFIRTFNSLERMCSTLLMQDKRIIISSALASTALSGGESDFLLNQMERCQKYIEIPTAERPDPEFTPPYREQARNILGILQHASFTLSDAPFIMKTQIASDGPIPTGLVDAVAVSMTEHVCTTDTFSDNKSVHGHGHYSGGYDWLSPHRGKVEFQRAKENLENMEFGIWAPSAAPEGMGRLRYLVAPPEANTSFRFPLPIKGEFPGVETALFRNAPAACDLPADGVFIGHTTGPEGKRKVRVTRDDRRRHMYMVGQTGTGKSTLFLNMIMQDIHAGEGVGLMDPHGELVEEVLERIPKERIEDVVYINPEELEHCVGLNLLEHRDSLEKDFAVNMLLEIFDKLYDMKTTGGPMFEMYMRNAILLVMEDPDSGSTIVEIQKIFTDKDFRARKLSKCRNPFVRDFWVKMAAKAGGDVSMENIAPYIVSKVSRFIYNDALRGIIGQEKSTINIRSIMDERKILLVDLCKGRLGETNSAFLGMILLGLILKAALSRTDVKNKAEMRDFYFYVDEFQNLATDSFISILSEARKYRLNAILTNQYLHQIPANVREAVLGNVGALISLRVGAQDASILEQEFEPVFSKTDLLNLAMGKGCASLLVNGAAAQPFSLETSPPPEKGRQEVAEALRQYALLKNGTPRIDVEESILRRWGIHPKEEDKNQD